MQVGLRASSNGYSSDLGYTLCSLLATDFSFVVSQNSILVGLHSEILSESD